MRDFVWSRFIPGNSVLHGLDPRTKLLGFLTVISLTLFLYNLLGLGALCALICLLFLAGRIPGRVALSSHRALFWLYLITFAIHLFLHPGKSLFDVPFLGISATGEGLLAGARFALRIAALLSAAILFMAVTAPQDLTDGLERLLRPLERFGLPIAAGALAISMALRFVPLLVGEAEKIRRSQLSRGADLEGIGIMRLHKTLPLILPLFACAMYRADHLAVALEARAYMAGSRRTQMIELRFKLIDLLALLTLFGAAVALRILAS